MMLTEREQKKREQLRLNKPLVYDKVMRYEERFARGESIAVIQLHYDYACNMFCEHCSISDFRKMRGEKRQFDPVSIRDLCDQADAYGLAQIDLTGGEPLLFPDLEDVIAAIGPERFYLMVDTNGWLMTPDEAKRLRRMGVDKVQIGIDNLYPEQHDAFRRKPGAHARALAAMDAVMDAGLALQVSTVITPERIWSAEFVRFLEFTKEKKAVVNSIWAKPAGEYATKEKLIVSAGDEARRMELCRRFDHLTTPHIMPKHGMALGCLAAKKIVAITAYGDVMPCIWMYYSLGNVFDEPLRDILQRGMAYFGKYHGKCLTSQDVNFIADYIENTRGRELPVRIEEVLGAVKVAVEV